MSSSSNAGPGLQGRRSVQAFALVTGGSGFLSNQFISPAGPGQDNFGNAAVDFRNEPPDPVALVQQTVAGTAGNEGTSPAAPGPDRGYRLLSAPVTGVTIGDLAAVNLVQGVPAGDGNTQPQYPLAGDNLFTSYDGTAYAPAPSTGFTVETGRGFFWDLYDAAFTVNNPADFGGGTSESFAIPERRLTAAGKVATPPSGSTAVSRAFADNGTGFHMTGNPFAHAMLASAITADVPIQNVVQAFQPATSTTAGTYVPIDRTSPTAALAVWQGVFAEITSGTGAVTFSFDATAAVPAQPAFVGRPVAEAGVALALTGTTAQGAATRDEAAIVRFAQGASAGWDAHDASKLTPLGSSYALLAPVAERDGASHRTAVSTLPVAAATVRLAFLATEAGTYTIDADAAGLPEGFTASLRDLATGAVSDLSTGYTFTSDATDWTERFELALAQRGATAGEAAPTEALRVLDARPNPVRGTSSVTVELGEAQALRAAVYDALGRRVQTLHDGQAAAGTLALRVDASRLAPGVYVVRVDGASASATQTLTVVR